MVSAIVSKAKLLGLMAEKSEITGKGGAPFAVRVDPRDPAVQIMLARWLAHIAVASGREQQPALPEPAEEAE